jgi:DNA-binding MarR family transcriptional regulator
MLLASRAVTRLYNDEIRRMGIEVTQFGMLQLLNHIGPMTQNHLGEYLSAGKTTISRNVKLLERNGWVSVEDGEDRRQRIVKISKAGLKQLERTEPYWQRAQERFEAVIARDQLQALHDLLPVAAEAAVKA